VFVKTPQGKMVIAGVLTAFLLFTALVWWFIK
jgi:hypothetical protein